MCEGEVVTLSKCSTGGREMNLVGGVSAAGDRDCSSNRRRHLDQCHRIRTRLPQSGKLSIESDGSTWLKLERSRLDRSRFAASAAAHEEYFLKGYEH